MPQNTLGDFIAPLQFETGTGEISNRRLALLVAIGSAGSISAAAREVGMTYKAAWDAVEAMTNLAGVALVSSQHGGKGGGGAVLTEPGKTLVADFSRVQRLQQQFLDQLQRDGDLGQSAALIRRLSIKSSARNVLTGTVKSIHGGGVNSEVNLELTGGESLHAIVTCESVRDMNLAEGATVQALIKASWIVLAAADDAMRTSARNRLCGKVRRVQEGEVNAEVVIGLPGGQTLAAVITLESLHNMKIGEGDNLCALIKASHIILGVAE